MKVKSFSHVQLFSTPWTAAHQAPLSVGFSRQEYRSGVPLPSPLYRTGRYKVQSHYLDYQCTGFAKNQFNETLISLIFPCLAKETNGFIIPEDCVCVCSVCVCVCVCMCVTMELSPCSKYLSFQI